VIERRINQYVATPSAMPMPKADTTPTFQTLFNPFRIRYVENAKAIKPIRIGTMRCAAATMSS
jgi:hypothetical protein